MRDRCFIDEMTNSAVPDQTVGCTGWSGYTLFAISDQPHFSSHSQKYALARLFEEYGELMYYDVVIQALALASSLYMEYSWAYSNHTWTISSP